MLFTRNLDAPPDCLGVVFVVPFSHCVDVRQVVQGVVFPLVLSIHTPSARARETLTRRLEVLLEVSFPPCVLATTTYYRYWVRGPILESSLCQGYGREECNFGRKTRDQSGGHVK